MLVSVVINAWNAADYLREAIESALAQTYQNLEVVVVDDGSTDHTREVSLSFGERVRYFYQEKDDTRGASAQRRAYAEARGEFIAGLDQDDRWLPGKIERQLKAMQADPALGVVFTRFRLIDGEGRDQGLSPLVGPSGDVFHFLLGGNAYCYSSALVRTSAYLKDGHPSVRTGMSDWDMWLRLSRHFPVAMLDEALTEYRVHGNAYSSNFETMARATERVLLRQKEILHPDCADCRAGWRKGWRVVVRAYLDHYHIDSRRGEFMRALPSLRRAAALSPAYALSPRQLAAVCKSAGLAALRRVKRDSA
ncbi:MAG TPA: glycosyltransferase [Pyrinomonadaceae bacterium]|nr:glycosyltransferase [Pyrinomonadaceae bacterium]